jgi:EAL domain-containing protein (putative c-di-GMP-specific phosphodiesterase class I)
MPYKPNPEARGVSHKTDREGLRVAVNVSVHQLREPGFATDVAAAMARVDLPPAALILEVTESALIADNDGTIETLEILQTLGIDIALDDFGTGYSSLSYVHKLPLDILKIDRSFVSGGQGLQNDQLVRTVVELGKAYGLEVVAEGIEDEAQLQRLMEAGCRFGQGYFLGRPTIPEGLIEKLEHLDQWESAPAQEALRSRSVPGALGAKRE